MKNLLNFKVIMILLLGTITLTSCDEDDDDVVYVPETISEIAAATPQLSNLVAALDRAGLAETLDNSGQYTVFAPTN